MFSWQTKKSMLKGLITHNSPFYIQFYVSKFCHLNCKMCNIVKANEDIVPFNNKTIEAIAKNLVKIGAGVVLLTGGEPFLRKDIDEIVRIFKAHKLDVRLQTAGLVKAWDKIKKCVEYGARDINVSLDSLDENLADYINGLKGSWKDAIRTISFITRTFPAKDSVCALGCVLSPYNVDEIIPILEFATEIGWWLSLVPAHIHAIERDGKYLNFRGNDNSFLFEEKDFPKIDRLIKELKLRKKRGFKLFDSDDYLDSIYHFIVNKKPSWRKHDVCDTPNLYFAILPDGRFAPCCDYRLKRNIYVYDRDFPNIYKSNEFVKEVKEIARMCEGCNFGSFPEMTLSARSFSTIKERILLQIKAKSQEFRKLSEEEMLNIIKNIKNKYKNIYLENRLNMFLKG